MPRKKKAVVSTTSVGAAGGKKLPTTHLAFARRRVELTGRLYEEWNREVFGGRLPKDLPLVWNPRLLSTAGQVW